ncbi:uncharacterized protein LOC117566539, partial [Drosophila albomicans]|uniref:Uncharacterized protein LOC117566539 n=1 Tax=Drosophila albomicans TaxID=7291 RepID=A0A6P8WEA5_DROAB
SHLSVLLLSYKFCASQELTQNKTNIVPNDNDEAHRLKALLDAIRPSTTVKPLSTSSTSKPKADVSSPVKDEPDFSFQNERLPLLSDDEVNSLTDDANPLYFLKQMPEEPKTQSVQETKPDPVSAPAPIPVSGSPIYITIPIYINTAGKMPLTLTIGDQEVSLAHQQRLNQGNRRASTKVPNSHFNRLLEMVEPPKRRTTNRHRSPSRSKIQAIKEHNSTQLYKEFNRKKSN